MRSQERTRRDEVEAAPHKPPAPEETTTEGALGLAGTIGNAAMQRVAESPELQSSPAAAGLAPTIARARRDELDPEASGAGSGAMIDRAAEGEELEEPEATVAQEGEGPEPEPTGEEEEELEE